MVTRSVGTFVRCSIVSIDRHLGVTGTQDGMTSDQVRRIESWSDTLIAHFEYLHHGDCIGADEQMANLFRLYMLIVSHPPIVRAKRAFTESDEIRPEKPYLERNRDIVNESFTLIAMPKGYYEIQRSGTWATIRYARQTHKRHVIVWPDGTYDVKGGDMKWV